VVHTADIRVRDFTSQAYFFEESLQALLTARERERHELERNRLAQPRIISAVNLAHCALAKQAHASVRRNQSLAGTEAAIVKGDEGLSSEGIEGCGQKSIGRCLLGEELLDVAAQHVIAAARRSDKCRPLSSGPIERSVADLFESLPAIGHERPHILSSRAPI